MSTYFARTTSGCDCEEGVHTFLSGWWFGTFFLFPYTGNVIIPTDELHHFFRGVGIPPTSSHHFPPEIRHFYPSQSGHA